MTRSLRRIALSLGFATALVAGFGNAPPASAVPQSTCFRDYYACMNTAANETNFWRRSAAGLDCTATLAGCVREALTG